MKKNLLRIALVFAVIGLGISVYLMYLYNQPEPINCLTNCEIVRSSSYSYFLGIRIPYLGIIYYLSVIFCLVSLIRNPRNELIKFILGIVTTSGLLFSMYLSYLEEIIIEAWCQWCILSALITLIIFTLSIFWINKKSIP